MNYTPNQQEASPKPAPNFAETTGAGPLAQTPGSATYSPNVTSTGRPQRRARMEQIGFWVVVVAALALLLVVLNVFLPRFISGAVLGFDIAAFVGLLTLLNLKSAAVWGNNVLGRKVFPVIDSTDREIWRLARVNTVLVFAFTFLLQVVASFLGLFFTSLIIFVALVGVAAYFARTRSVIIKP